VFVGEPLHLLLEPTPPPPPQKQQVDIVFVLDATQSMQFAIDGTKAGIQSFVDGLDDDNLDSRVGLVAFRDSSYDTPPQILDFNGAHFSNDPVIFRNKLSQVRAAGGGDIPESSFDALAIASDLNFRAKSEKVLVLITDAPPRIPDTAMRGVEQTAKRLSDNEISQLHVVTMKVFEGHYRDVQTTSHIRGKFFSLSAAAAGSEGFDDILPEVGQAITVASVKGLQSGVEYADDQTSTLLALVGLWTGILSCGICLTLIAAQNASLRRQLMTLPEALKGGGGSLATGIISGIAGQLLFQYALGTTDTSEAIDAGNYSREIISRVCAWIMLGGMLGGTMAFFIPNLKWSSAAIGGMIGGGIGAGGYLLTSSLGYSLGRILGAACLGLLIGLMVALSEIVSRSYWLEISYGKNEKTRVNLGARPVTVGNDRSCTVWLSTGPPVKYSYAMEEGVIFCSDVATGHSISVKPNDANAINHITLTVRAAAVDSAQPMPLPPVAPPPPPPKKTKYASTAKTGDSPVPSSRPINSTRPPGTLPPPPPIKKDKQG
ncbi:MAG: VWA domain-containing protein, partial [Planctomycetaceae bacterium]|nr:VWA domain-containing protein [Planctomycetaceae bacterium]